MKHKSFPYKITPVQGLTENHIRQRFQFCGEMLRLMREVEGLTNKIIFTDEATFTTSGMFNRKNKRYWSTENTHQYQVVRTQGRQSLNVWCGILGGRVLGPIIFEGTLNGERYKNFLEHEIEHELQNIPNRRDLIWQQDGAPSHNIRSVVTYLNNHYNLWIGRNGPIRWPANSPDLTPLDLFLWGYLKNKVYYDRPENINILRQKIEQETLLLQRENVVFVTNALRKWKDNVQKCYDNGGGYIEP